VEYLLAGASAVQVGTATFVDPDTPARVAQGIEEYAKGNALETIEAFHRFIA
jgi:dihydroorotate dehydrogenase (NAD+) catalytic subunit